MSDRTYEKRCQFCAHFTPMFPDDDTAGEGSCSVEDWEGPLWLNGAMPTFGYHPHVQRADYCSQHAKAEASQ